MKVTKESIYRDVVTGEEHDLYWFQFVYGKVSVNGREFIQLQKPVKVDDKTYIVKAAELGEEKSWAERTVTYNFNGVGWTPRVTVNRAIF